IISIETPGSHAFPNVSAWPMMRLPTSEPLRLPRPPTTTTISAGIRIVTPTEGYADWIGPAITPASPPRAPAERRAEGEDAGEHAVRVDPEARGHLGVEDPRADDRAETRLLDQEPERERHDEPEGDHEEPVLGQRRVAERDRAREEGGGGGRGGRGTGPPQIRLPRSAKR